MLSTSVSGKMGGGIPTNKCVFLGASWSFCKSHSAEVLGIVKELLRLLALEMLGGSLSLACGPKYL